MNAKPNQNDRQQGEQPQSPMQRMGCSSWMIWLVLLAILAPWAWRLLMGEGTGGIQVNYTTFLEQVQTGNVGRVTVSGDQISGEFLEPIQQEAEVGEEPLQVANFITYRPDFGGEELFAMLMENQVEIATEPQQDISILMILFNVLPFIFFIGLGILLFRRMQGQGESVFSMGKSRARLYERSDERTTFEDVAGARGAKRELEEIIEYLRDPNRFERLGGEIPRGVLLVGPPGTGKTLLARAVAGEANVPFFSITGSDFMEMFVGVGASRVRDLFQEAKKSAPSIIFIDELDSIGRRRGAGIGGGHDEREQTLNQMLSEMDGFEPNTNVIVMAATNRPDILDPALLRPGRFDRRITVDLPTMHDRLAILKIHARNKPLAEDVDLETVARGTPGFSGADLENLLNEAALLAARKRKDRIEEEDISAARDKVLMGLERENMVLTDEEWRLLAYHEAGHAVVAAALPHADPIHKVTIVPRGRAMGVTQQLPERDRYLYPRDYMLDRMAVMMGGRAAEELVLGTMTSGAANDLKQATLLARRMILEWGMSENIGHVAWGGDQAEVFLGEDLAKTREYSESTAQEIDREIRKLLEEAFSRATSTLEEHRDGLKRVVEALLESEEVPGSQVLELLGLEQREREEARERPFSEAAEEVREAVNSLDEKSPVEQEA